MNRKIAYQNNWITQVQQLRKKFSGYCKRLELMGCNSNWKRAQVLKSQLLRGWGYWGKIKGFIGPTTRGKQSHGGGEECLEVISSRIRTGQ